MALIDMGFQRDPDFVPKRRYLYQAATIGSVFQYEPSTMSHARKVVAAHRKNWAEIEVERVLDLSNGARRYWRWRSGRWTTDITSDPKPADLARWDEALP